MTDELPPQRPEGKLIEDAAKATGLSIRRLVAAAGISDARWRQIVKGNQSVGAGRFNEVVAPPATLARMAIVVGLKPSDLIATKRPDAAGFLSRLQADLEDGGSIAPLPFTGSTGPVPDEIDMIYASRSMTAQEKLDAIRKVLHLRAQVDAEAGHDEAGAERTDAPNAR